MILKQSTAVDVLIGPFVDLTNAATAETGESPSVKLSKNGQTMAAKNDVTTPVHDADGYYNCELDATDTNTVGTLILTVAASANALPVRHEFQVVEESTYDALYAAAAAGFDASGDVTVGTMGSGIIGSSTFVSGAITSTVLATNAIDNDVLATTAVDEIVDGVWDEPKADHTTSTNMGAMAADIGTAGAGLTDLGGMSTAMKGEVNAEVDTAISDAALATAAALATVDANVDSVLEFDQILFT